MSGWTVNPKFPQNKVHPDDLPEAKMAGFFQQLKALLWRNVLLKKRSKGQLFQELFFPVYFVAILAVVKLTTAPDTKPKMTFPSHDVNSTDYGEPFKDKYTIYGIANDTKYTQIMQHIVSRLNGPPGFKMFNTESEAEESYKKNSGTVKFGVIFEYGGDENAYAIRIGFSNIVTSLNDFSYDEGTCRGSSDGTDSGCPANKYLSSGFVQLQLAIEDELMREIGVPDPILASRNTFVQMMDLETYDPDTSYIQNLSSIYFVFSFSVLASYLVGNIVAEKEKKIKDGMLMMGLNPNVFWLSWSIIYMGMIIFIAMLMIAIVTLSKFFENSNIFLFFIMIFLYGTSFVALAFMITPFFNKARVAGAVSGLSTVVISLLYLAISLTRDEGSYDSDIPVPVQWIMYILSPVAFASCIDKAIFLDIRMGGFNFDDSLTYGQVPLYASILMLAVDTVLYALLTLYFDKVIPGEFGVTYKPWFFLQSSYWFPSKMDDENQHWIPTDGSEPQSIDVEVEPVPTNMRNKAAMKISSITKSFLVNKEVVTAVNEFSLDIYEGQITCLLGHNGAGKTTLINMLTGVVPPTSGTARIMGLYISRPEDMSELRKSCGICPQHNILYDNLSCKEHLYVFADIKGVPPEEREDVVLQSLKDVDLETQADTFAVDLSGGQKRKLSVAIALIGDPRLIFLDEPTAGMDPYSRRHLWGLLKKKKEGRIVLLTTHFMDEADILSDRKAFIRKGKLRCCGSSLFLKNKFGVGYHLTMVVEPTTDVDKVTSFLTSIISGIKHERSHGKEVSYTIPLSDVSKFSLMFGKLDDASKNLGIKSYGVSMTTLEEVFLKLEDLEHVDESELDGVNAKHNGHHNATTGEDSNESETNVFFEDLITDDKQLTKQQFKTLFWIRFLAATRNKKVVFVQVILPVLLVIAGLVVIKVGPSPSVDDPSPLAISLNNYANSTGNKQLKNLLVFDSLGTTDSNSLISDWEKNYTVDSYTTGTTNTSFVRPHYVGVQLDEMTGKYLTNFTALYNRSALHSIPAIVSFVTQSLISAAGFEVKTSVFNFPWPKVENKIEYNGSVMTSGILIGLAFILIIPGFVTEIVRDREKKLRSQLRISGVTFNVYWSTIYCLNFLIYLIPGLLIIILTLSFQIPGLDSAGAIGAIALLFLCNLPFFCFFAIIVSFIFDKADSCSTYLPFLLNMGAIIPYILVTILDAVLQNDVSIYIHYVFCFIDPPYILLGGFYFINRVSLMSSIQGSEGVSDSDYFDPANHTLVAIFVPIFHMIWMYWLLRVLDVAKTGGKIKEAFPCFAKSINSSETLNNDIIQNEDDDVKNERVRIDSMSAHVSETTFYFSRCEQNEGYSSSARISMEQIDPKAPVAYARNLRKTFMKRVEKKTCSKPGKMSTKVAVRNLSVGVNEGEVLGLLGPNGAGKTTALNMIIAETEPTCGKVFVGGHDIRSNLLNMSTLGYCPQHDALWDGITMREHIICFAAIKGVPMDKTEGIVDFYANNMKLHDHILKRAKKLSGGTKRKLSYILSILGNPNMVLMDEPSTGMDPQSKRFLWDTISSTFRNTDKGAILTTHYMEEADALCSRVGILVNGELRCLGSTQHLKDTFGSGYILEVKLSIIQSSEINRAMDRLEEHLRELFPDFVQVERFMERAQYAIPKDNVKSLGATFANLEECKHSHQLEEYNFSQSSLEQVFLYFAKQQMDERIEEPKKEIP